MIGIFGGSFDPVHNGHLQVATQAVCRLKLQQLQFMPCALPVHRECPQATPAQRCAMLDLVIRERPEFSLNKLELERRGPSFSIDSLRQIRARTDGGLLLLLGADAFNGFGNWKQPREILRLAHLVVCLRPGSEVNPGLFPDHRIHAPSELAERSVGGILQLEVDAPDCSSSLVRALLEAGKNPTGMLHPEVAKYINRHHLYRRPVD